MSETPIVKVEEGELQGRLLNSPSGKAYYTFFGIPYAKPPIGSLRFRAPQPAEPWEGIRDATSEGNICAQVEENIKEYQGDENCLFLNVYTPDIDGDFPVMFYVHGGGFRFGNGSPSTYGGDYLVEKDVVVVTINYRLGPLGFLCLNTPEVPGNAGLKDIAQALRWVKQNIKNFGGNSENLTVFGHSAGAAAVSLLTASPLTKNLISKVIIQSGSALSSFVLQNHPLDNARDLAKILGSEASDVNELLEFLTTTPVRDLVEAYGTLKPFETFLNDCINIFSVVVEKEFPGVDAFLTEPYIDLLTSGRLADIPVMVGVTSLEVTTEKDGKDLQVYIPADLNIGRDTETSLAVAEEIKSLYFKGDPWSDECAVNRYKLTSDVLFNIDTHRNIKYLLNTTNKPIYFYNFDYVGNLSGYFAIKPYKLEHKQAVHGDELSYLFKVEMMQEKELSPQDVKVRERLLRLWTNFARESNPTPVENHYLNVTWLPVTKDSLNYLNISNELTVAANPDNEKMEFWQNLYIKYYKSWDQRKHVDETPVSEVVESTSSVPIIVEDMVATPTDDEEDDENQKVEENNADVVEEVANDIQVVNDVQVANDVQVVNDVQVANDVQDSVVVQPDVVQQIEVRETTEVNVVSVEKKVAHENGEEAKLNGSIERKPRPSNEIKMVQPNNVNPKDVIRANDPPEDDLPKNIGVNKFVNFFESLGGKK